MNPCELTAAITAAANSIACQLDSDQLGLLAAVFTQLGDTLATIVAQRGICEKACSSDNGIQYDAVNQ